MANYTFETITDAQAIGITTADSVSFTTGTAVLSAVTYGLTGDILITLGARTVDFGSSVLFSAENPGLSFADGSLLYIGDGTANVISLQTIARPSAGFGGDGNDIIRLGSAGGLAQGNQGDDNIATQGQATLYGGQGDDTLFGDADLSGTVDDTDYFLANDGFLNNKTGWVHGDFDFGGTVDDTDFFLLNNGYLNQ